MLKISFRSRIYKKIECVLKNVFFCWPVLFKQFSLRPGYFYWDWMKGKSSFLVKLGYLCYAMKQNFAYQTKRVFTAGIHFKINRLFFIQSCKTKKSSPKTFLFYSCLLSKTRTKLFLVIKTPQSLEKKNSNDKRDVLFRQKIRKKNFMNASFSIKLFKYQLQGNFFD